MVVILTIILLIFGLTNFLKNQQITESKQEKSLCGGADFSKVIELGLKNNKTGKKLFTDHCSACHSMTQKIVGPNLYNVHKRQTKEWLYQFIKNPQRMIDSKDEYAVAIYNEYDKLMMPPNEFLTVSQIDSIVAYIKYESAINRK
jgi:cytochrome c551/c552